LTTVKQKTDLLPKIKKPSNAVENEINTPEDRLIATILLETIKRFYKIKNGLNYLGFKESYVPILTYDYLSGIARSFVQSAAQANREYIAYKGRAEEEDFTIRQMEQAVELNYDAWLIEMQNLDTAEKDLNLATYFPWPI
jgi:hypothetical protein